MGNKKKTFINTHTHIFTIKNVPPYIAKTFVPWPIYVFLHIKVVMGIYSFIEWLEKFFKKIIRRRRRLINFLKTRKLTLYLYKALSVFLSLNALIFLLNAFNLEKRQTLLDKIIAYIESSPINPIIVYDNHWAILLGIISSIFLLYPQVWKLFFTYAKKIFSFLKILPSTKSIEFIKRYFNIVKFANYSKQKKIFDKLIKMTEPGSKVVVLPMDMEYMKAGKPAQTYLDQLEEINDIFVRSMKNHDKMIPFVFVDPRRIRKETKKGETKFFDWDIEEKEVNGKIEKRVILNDCLLKKYLEKDGNDKSKGNFKGIKLYPALGYYPFDEDLLALYHYCVDHNLPILTHCVQGTIFYRGRMKEIWNYHPVFDKANGDPLDTRTQNNYELQVNFTHPLNYLVLTENQYLYRVIKKSKNEKLKNLFNLNENIQHVDNKLSKLRINIAHYGGVEEWEKYLELDRSETSFEIRENPDQGINFTHSQSSGKELLSKPADLYQKKADWFTIISSLMLQYENIYSDISYILHSEKMMPLLNDMLINNDKLSSKILYGTDFFVVRNHKSEKQLYSDLLAIIGEEKMDVIARENPARWLNL